MQSGTTPLLAACKKGQYETVQLLIQKGAVPTKHDDVCWDNNNIARLSVCFTINLWNSAIVLLNEGKVW